MIYPHHLEFMEEAKNAFESNPRFETYRNTEGNLIALRHGLDRNCIGVHEIGKEIGFFAEVMDRAPELVVSSPIKREVTAFNRFDIRQVMLARPDEWVGAYKLNGIWYKTGFCSDRMSLVFSEYSSLKSTLGASLTMKYSLLNDCIPIEDVPEEDCL